jgi:hypothetical protein
MRNQYEAHRGTPRTSREGGSYDTNAVGAGPQPPAAPGPDPTVDPTKVSAEYKNGVLTLKLPLREEAKPHQIHVDVAA